VTSASRLRAGPPSSTVSSAAVSSASVRLPMTVRERRTVAPVSSRPDTSFPRGPFPPFESRIPPEAAELILEWLRDGGYDEAIAQIAAEDPDLANQ